MRYTRHLRTRARAPHRLIGTVPHPLIPLVDGDTFTDPAGNVYMWSHGTWCLQIHAASGPPSYASLGGVEVIGPIGGPSNMRPSTAVVSIQQGPSVVAHAIGAILSATVAHDHTSIARTFSIGTRTQARLFTGRALTARVVVGVAVNAILTRGPAIRAATSIGLLGAAIVTRVPVVSIKAAASIGLTVTKHTIKH